jgi:cation diffusion facilitator CzcD-associated flavoprotein CzcO
MHRNDCDVAVIGAGPYGLAAAAHLRAARIDTRVFGEAMGFWKNNMPKGMWLRSPWIASHIADPKGKHSLDHYASLRGFAPQEQLPIDDFVGYGEWFQQQIAPDLDTRKVVGVERMPQGFRITLGDGASVNARRVVIAMGMARQEFKPAQFDGLPGELVTHTCDHDDFARFAGKRVAVVGRGQSACETAVLLSEQGAEVELISRGDVMWLGDGAAHNAFLKKVRQLLAAPSAVGPFPLDWLVEMPGLTRHLPADLLAKFNERCLRAKASGWLKPRAGKVRMTAGAIRNAVAVGDQITLSLDESRKAFDHVVLGTGYKIDVAKLGIFTPRLLSEIATVNGSPSLGSGMESTSPGLHFIGATAVNSYGPQLRFVCGAGFAARSVTRAVLGNRIRPQRRAASVLTSQTSTSA